MYSLTTFLKVLGTITTAHLLLLFATFSSRSLLCQAVPAPVDLFNSAYDEIKRASPQQQPSNLPDLCPENLNNDNITHFRWYRFHNGSQKCWHIDQRGPCGQNMIFYRVGDTEFGECDCNFYYRCARPLIYWAPEKRCYFTNEQGPCKENEWLVVTGKDEEDDKSGDGAGSDDDTLLPTCIPNPCVHNQTVQRSRKDRYWFENKGECYMTLTRGYCSHPDEVLYTKWDEHQPSCHIGRECNVRKVRGANIRSANSRSSGSGCLPGQKVDERGRCRKLVRISWWSVLSRK